MQTLSGLMRLLEQGEGPRPAKCRNLPRLQLQVLPALTQGCSLSWTWERGIALLQAGGPLTTGAGAVGVHFEPR